MTIIDEERTAPSVGTAGDGQATTKRTGTLGKRLDLRTYVERLETPAIGVLLIVAIVGLLVGSITAVSIQRREPVYESSQLLIVDQPEALALAPSGDLVAKLASLRIKYVSLLQSTDVLGAAARDLGVDPGVVAGAVRASAPTESLLIRITARAPEAGPASAMAAAVGKALSDHVREEQAALKVPQERRITVDAIRPASSAAQIEPNTQRSLSSGLVAGLVAAGLIYLLLGFVPLFGNRRRA